LGSGAGRAAGAAVATSDAVRRMARIILNLAMEA